MAEARRRHQNKRHDGKADEREHRLKSNRN
jgi:hypothetical protein